MGRPSPGGAKVRGRRVESRFRFQRSPCGLSTSGDYALHTGPMKKPRNGRGEKPAKASLASILRQAEEARILVSGNTTRKRGLEEFDRLVSDYPSDGMVYFKRAEAREALSDSGGAADDYRKAQRFFYKRLWRDLAESRAERLDKAIAAEQFESRVRSSLGPKS